MSEQQIFAPESDQQILISNESGQQHPNVPLYNWSNGPYGPYGYGSYNQVVNQLGAFMLRYPANPANPYWSNQFRYSTPMGQINSGVPPGNSSSMRQIDSGVPPGNSSIEQAESSVSRKQLSVQDNSVQTDSNEIMKIKNKLVVEPGSTIIIGKKQVTVPYGAMIIVQDQEIHYGLQQNPNRGRTPCSSWTKCRNIYCSYGHSLDELVQNIIFQSSNASVRKSKRSRESSIGHIDNSPYEQQARKRRFKRFGN